MISGVYSDDSSLQLEATTQFRKLLSIGNSGIRYALLCFYGIKLLLTDNVCCASAAERSPPIEEVIQSGVVPRFVEFLGRDDFPQLQV